MSAAAVRINFKLLNTFLAVAENVSFRKASEQTHLSLPAVSMQIKQLEEQLGVGLFHRTTRRVELTREGERLMISARKAMAELDGTLARIQQAANVQQGHLAIACVPTVAGTRLPALMIAFARCFPGISVRVRELSQPGLLEAVRKREVDFGIGPQPERLGELKFQGVFEDPYMALLPAAHPAAAKATVSLRELAQMPLLTMGASQFHRQLMQAFDEEGLKPELNYEFTNVSTAVAMAEAGLGVSIMPSVGVPRQTVLKSLKIVRPALSRTIGIVTIRGHALSPSASRFVDMCDTLIPPSAEA